MKAMTEEQSVKLKSFLNCFVEYPLLTEIMGDFDRLRQNRLLGGDQQCMLLTGDTGCGKSHLIRYYQSREQYAPNDKFDSSPILVSRIPSKLTLEETVLQLLKDLGQFGTTTRGRSRITTDSSLTHSLVDLLRKKQVELIIINEFQELIEYKSAERRQAIANRLKYISEEAGVPIVLVGMPWAEMIAEEPQWSSRLVTRRSIPYFKLSEDPIHFVQFLKGLAKKMPFDRPPKLEDKKTSISLFAASRGELRALRHLINDAVKDAVLEDEQEFDVQRLCHSFAKLNPQGRNPFDFPLSEMKLSEIEHYSGYNPRAMSNDEALTNRVFSENIPLKELLKKKG